MRFRPDGLSPNAWAVKAGVSRTVWTDMRRHGNPSRRTLEKLLKVAGSSLAEFEALRLGPEPADVLTASSAGRLGDVRPGWTAAPLASLPLIASTLAGEWREPGSKVELFEIRPRELLDRLQRPTSLAADARAFALTVVGDSMWPRFRPGSRIAVSPRAPVALGDDVLVRLRASDEHQREEVERVLIMQLVKRTGAGLDLRQFNPDKTVHVGEAEVDGVLKIAGELI
jgi:SOS-response transcriptional repressor LexA